jgi:hypothetical protein
MSRPCTARPRFRIHGPATRDARAPDIPDTRVRNTAPPPIPTGTVEPGPVEPSAPQRRRSAAAETPTLQRAAAETYPHAAVESAGAARWIHCRPLNITSTGTGLQYHYGPCLVGELFRTAPNRTGGWQAYLPIGGADRGARTCSAPNRTGGSSSLPTAQCTFKARETHQPDACLDPIAGDFVRVEVP